MESEKSQQEGFQCEIVDSCPLLIQLNGSCGELVKKLKQRYCFKDNSYCARYYLSQILGIENVPASMLPHQWDWANQILQDAGKIAEIRDPDDM